MGVVDELGQAAECIVGARQAIVRVLDSNPADSEVLQARLRMLDAQLVGVQKTFALLINRRRAQER